MYGPKADLSKNRYIISDNELITSHCVDSLIYTRRAMVVIISLSTTLGTTSILTFKFNLWNFGIECLLMIHLVREAINCHMLYSYLNHFWCSLFHSLSQWRHVKEWANNKQRLWLSEQTQDNFCLFVLAHSLAFFFSQTIGTKVANI